MVVAVSEASDWVTEDLREAGVTVKKEWEARSAQERNARKVRSSFSRSDTTRSTLTLTLTLIDELFQDLDLNDPQTLQVYSQLLLFSSLPSPPNPSTTEMEGLDSSGRRKVKMVAGMLGLGYGSEEVGGGGKRVLLWKAGQHPGPQQVRILLATVAIIDREC